ncbi:MAG: hypothetical protein LC800_16270 [Acidobacteria bacterium]|nr:hypothetical protein [Acidobacteriota bacterium]
MDFEAEVDSTLAEMRQHLRAAGREQLAPGARAGRGALARMEVDLAITERSWSRLPPLTSSRRGWVARVELWVKRALKRATHWLTWEQVNFNAAVNHSLRATHDTLIGHERQLAELRAQVEQLSARAEEFESLKPEIERLRRASGTHVQ